ncbi:von Willebrand factor type A domain-containing protein, partial [Akkermansiaceae bacterium]|nr:von Willebrand factor type A domain-containing protein [Akkermansiaceae bacterium]
DEFSNDYLYLKLDESSLTGKVDDGKALLKGQGKMTIVTEDEDIVWSGSVDQPLVKAPQAVDKEESEQKTNADFISPVERTTIPGIPAAPNQEVSGIATAGLRSGAAAVNRNSIDAILNSPEKAPEAGNMASGNLVGQELVRRVEPSGNWDTLLLEGRELYAAGNYEGAVSKYRASLDTLPSGYADKEREKVIREHLGDGSVALSEVARRSGRYEEARDLLKEAIAIDPENSHAAARLKKSTDPDRPNSGDGSEPLSQEHAKIIEEVRENLYAGFGHFDKGDYNKAEEEFKEALRVDPYNKAARRGLEKISAAQADYYRAAYDETRSRMLMEVDKAWELAVPPVDTEAVRSASIASKPQQIVIPVVDFENTTLEEVLDFLRIRSIELDVATLNDQERGIDFVLRPNAEGESLSAVKIPSLKMKDAPISEVLEEVAKKAGLEIRMDEWAIVLKPESENSEEWTPEVGRDGVSKEADAKLAMTNLPVLDFNNTTLSEGLDFLNIRSQELSGSENAGVEFTFEDEALGDLIVDKLYLSRVPLNVASKYLAEKTGTRYRIKDGKVVFYSDRPIVKKKAQSFETLTSEKTDSTFSLNVSDVSFKLAKSSLAEGKWPEAAKVRPEEFVNALDYDDRKPSQSEKVACEIEQGTHPFMQQRNLMRVSMSTAALGRNASTPLRLTILLDQSGSMERADRAESVKRAFALLTAQLNAGDEVTLVGFARTPRLLAERVKGNESGKLLEIVSRTLTEGGTNLEGALASGIQLAKQQYVEGAQNRIILLTDGAANLGDALPANLAKQVEQIRQADIAFDACGVGADGLNDDILSSLTKQGDGRYYFLDRPEDADEGFARQIA